MLDKLHLMQEDMRFDVADSEVSGTIESSPGPVLPAALQRIKAGIVAPKTPPKVPKVMLSNDCIFNCSYCGCRSKNEHRGRYVNQPKEFAEMCHATAKANGNKLFITSAIHQNPHYTEELIIETMRILRMELGFRGYIHAKIMPGCDPELIQRAGLYANRMSVNIEVAKSEGYTMIAREKSRKNILTPMGKISRYIREAKEETGRHKPRFAFSQTTQLMAGGAGEDDATILNLSHAMYDKYQLARVYYTAFTYIYPAQGYEERAEVRTPSWRPTRLYQADRLMQLYGFTPEDITPTSAPNLSGDFDPKAAWALRNMHLFPVEVNTADYEMLIRIPGIGITYAKRIIEARRQCKITHDVLTQLGVSLKRSRHFMTANGKFWGMDSSNVSLYADVLRAPLEDTRTIGMCER